MIRHALDCGCRHSAFGKTAAAVALSLLLAGCTVYTEGESEYRRVNSAGVRDPKSDFISLDERYLLPGVDDPQAIDPETDGIHVNLRQVFIKEVTDWPSRGVTRLFNNTAEIAILANVYQGNDATKSLAFTRGEAQQGTLVFFSPDVAEGQFLNLSNVSLFGPQDYHGQGLVVQLFIMEMDFMSDGTKALMKTLAQAGIDYGAAAHPAAALAAPMLKELGSALINGNHDDVILTYSFVLSPLLSSGTSTVATAPLLEGEYVILRDDDRNGAIDPMICSEQALTTAVDNCLAYDRGKGRLVDVGTGAEYRGSTYMVVSVERTDRGRTELKKRAFSELLAALNDESLISTAAADRAVGNVRAALRLESYDKLTRTMAQSKNPDRRYAAAREYLNFLIKDSTEIVTAAEPNKPAAVLTADNIAELCFRLKKLIAEREVEATVDDIVFKGQVDTGVPALTTERQDQIAEYFRANRKQVAAEAAPAVEVEPGS